MEGRKTNLSKQNQKMRRLRVLRPHQQKMTNLTKEKSASSEERFYVWETLPKGGHESDASLEPMLHFEEPIECENKCHKGCRCFPQ
jgi:hypothetical protein